MNNSRLWLTLSVLAGVLITSALAALAFWAILTLKPVGVPLAPTPEWLVTIVPAPTLTPVVTNVVSENQPSPTPTPPPAGEFGVGVYVQINGTGGEGLRLRADPNKAATPLFLGMDSEVFLVKDGPRQADNYTWWFLEAPYDKKRSGWAVQDYLRVIDNP